MTVIAARELEDPVTPGRRPREPNGAHRRLRAGGDEPDQLERGHRIDELLGELHLALGRGAERRSLARGRDHRLNDLGIRVPEDQRPPRHHPVDVAAAGLVLDPRALAAADEERLVEADGAHRPHRRVDAARNHLASPPPQARCHSHSASSFVQ